MKLITESSKKRTIITPEKIPFKTEVSGLYLLEVSARTRNEKQLSGTDDEDLRIEIDQEKFPQLNNRKQNVNSPASFSGATLKNLKKSVFFLALLEPGEHILSLIPDISATLETIKIWQIEDTLIDLPLDVEAEDGDRRPWITFVLVNVGLKEFFVSMVLKRRFIDSDDVKVVIDGEIRRNHRSILHKFWFFIASLVTSENQNETFNVDFSPGLHYIELWADRMPSLNLVRLEYIIADSHQIQQYKDERFHRNYNLLDDYILKSTSFWNSFFSKQDYPPPKLLDPSLVKAIVYRESRLGYFPDETIIDVMQVWDPRNPARAATLGEAPASEFISTERNGHIEYSYPKERVPPKVNTREESIFWGVRWLYHKAQRYNGQGKRKLHPPYKRWWIHWEEAIRDYNGNPSVVDEYIREVFSVYENGRDLEGNQLW